ncbi:MAG TPA: recombinase family protein [Symbiobacteriaceae bacterium]|nr:recombinase family protein [Symbiobacteriaceae bacterium]
MFSAPAIDPNRVAVYIRWSTDEQTQGTTLEVQRDACRHFLQSQGWHFRDDLTFVDDGYSGGNMERPALSTLRSAVRAGGIAAVVVYKLDRLSRNLLDCVTLVRQEWAGVALFSTMERFDTQSSIGQMVFNILVSFAEFERNIIRERTMSGKRKRWEQGRNSGFKYAYGYRKSAEGGFAIDPGPAAVVKGIFADYLQGAGYASIRDRLNREGIPAPGGGLWRICTIQLMLRNPVYAGHLAAGYYTYVGGRQKRGKGPARLVHNAVPPILSQSVFDQVQTLREGKAQAGPVIQRDSDYILSTIIRCARCGGPMVGHNGTGGGRRRYYRCANGKEFGKCDCGAVPKDEIEEAVLHEVRERYSPVQLRRRIEQMEARRLETVAARRQAVEQLMGRQAELKRKREKLDDDYFAGELDAKGYGRLANRLDADLEAVGRQVEAARQAVRQAEQSTVDTERLGALVAMLDGLAELGPQQIRRVLRQMLSAVWAYRAKSKGRYNKTPTEVTIEHHVQTLAPACRLFATGERTEGGDGTSIKMGIIG